MTTSSFHGTEPDSVIRISKEPITWPDSPGWWWCREILAPKAGEEECVYVTDEFGLDDLRVLANYDAYSKDRREYRGMEWIKADFPWRNQS